MSNRKMSKADFEALAAFRYQLRRFLRLSEQLTRDHGVTPLQYQLLLQIKGFPGREWASVAELAERLQAQHHGVVALISRCEAAGLVRRHASRGDQRRVEVHLTPAGEQRLEQLARLHRDELQSVQGGLHDPQLFEAIVAQAPDAVILADRDGVIRIWNRGAEAVFGFSAGEAIGQSLDIIIPERLRSAHWQGFQRAIENGTTRYSNQVRTTRSIHKDGRKLYVDLSFGLVTDAAGTVVGALAIGHDSSARYAEGKALRDRLALLEARQPV